MQTLKQLYEKHLNQFKQFVYTFPTEHFEGPLLMDPSGYYRQSRRLLIVGQETYGWGCEYDNVEAQLELYRNFNMGEKYWATPFWNLTRKMEDILGIEKYSCAWSNLNRFDHNGGSANGECREKILDELSKLDFLIKEEIQILKPDVCLFFTNRKYDHRIKALYPEVQFQDIEGLPGSHFARLTHEALPKLTLRTPHPRTIRTRKWEEALLIYMREAYL
jgi:hypothetical protein